MITSYDIVQSLIRTEKGSTLESQGKYLFQVALGSNKVEIQKAVEDIYKVKVATVNTVIMPEKRKRVRQQFGYTSQWKKAIVTLQQGFKIDVT